MPARIFGEWIQFYRQEPFGEDRDDVRSAIIAAVIADVNRGKGKPRAKIEDFVAAKYIVAPDPQPQLTDAERVQKAMFDAQMRGWDVIVGKD